MATETNIVKTWVASGPAGAVGSIHQTDEGYTFKLLSDDDYRGTYPSLEVVKSALHASLEPGSEWPEFREH
ncbi:methyltransferase [Parafrigoribacterium soli]|uniref:methyltransferase n=1 Tax=Parafrigoribacterium soli TaxID=3144663 RepID=UPI0032ED8430